MLIKLAISRVILGLGKDWLVTGRRGGERKGAKITWSQRSRNREREAPGLRPAAQLYEPQGSVHNCTEVPCSDLT